MSQSVTVHEVKRHLVRVEPLHRKFFEVECNTAEEAEFLRSAVEVYENFQNVRTHMHFALQRIDDVAPKPVENKP